MQLTKFGRTGMSVSRLCLGTATFGKQTDEAESHRILALSTRRTFIINHENKSRSQTCSGNFPQPLSTLVWIVDAYTLTLTFGSLLLLGGSLADWIGAKRAYISGLAIFVCTSALCGFATSTAFLIIARLLQGIGAAFFLPSSLTLLTQSFPERFRRARCPL
jgi:MFS family permease